MEVVSDVLLEKGRQSANFGGKPVLVSQSRSMGSSVDPIALFRESSDEEPWKVFWSQPSRNEWIVGIGAVSILNGTGDSRFSQIKQGLQSLMAGAFIEAPEVKGIGPRVLGGFRFNSLAQTSNEWANYGDGFMLLPRVSYMGNEDGAWVTENHIIYPDGYDQQNMPRVIPRSKTEYLSRYTTHSQSTDDGALKHWRASVCKILEEIRAGKVEKVVLARKVIAHDLLPVNIDEVLSRLTVIDPECTVFAITAYGTTFLGATPEPVLKISGTELECVCEAGSAPRGSTYSEDSRLANDLLADPKERWEHSLLVDSVSRSLKPLCDNLNWPSTPEILKLRNVQHLCTIFKASNNQDLHALDFVERLHPTPAVSGVPKEQAVRIIDEIEDMDRGWYGGLVGWTDGSGEGEFTIALRSALLHNRDAMLYAGAGIVKGSDPEREFAETGFKLQTMISALEISN